MPIKLDLIFMGKHVDIYTDGSCPANPGPGGWAFVIPSRDIYIGGSEWKTTNNLMEMAALQAAIQWSIDNDEPAKIYCDSQYCTRSWNNWMHQWAKGKWKKPKKNKEKWKELYGLYAMFNGSVEWCKGHSGIHGNEEADALAGEYVDILVNG